jgi:hypothetical protein
MSRREGLKGMMSRDFLLRRLTDEVVPVFVVELGGDGDDPTEEVGHKTQMFHLGLTLDIVLPQAVTSENTGGIRMSGKEQIHPPPPLPLFL